MATIGSLAENGVITVASQPPKNGELSGSGPLVIPLIAEDYPAKTAVMWNAAFKAFGLQDRNAMVIADPLQAGEILEAFRKDPRYIGGGAGVGFKEAVVAHLDAVEPIAQAMGSVNIIRKIDGRLVGSNTDGAGYVASLERLFPEASVERKHILMLGAGGTGRAIAFFLARKGARISIVNRTVEKAVELASAVNAFVSTEAARGFGREHIGELIPSADAVVSVIDDAHSPLDEYSTLGSMALPITEASVLANRQETADLLASARPGLVVSDIRIRKSETAMLRQAREAGFAVLNGIPMVINQGVQAFWWIYGDTLSSRGVSEQDVEHIMRDAASW